MVSVGIWGVLHQHVSVQLQRGFRRAQKGASVEYNEHPRGSQEGFMRVFKECENVTRGSGGYQGGSLRRS